MYQIISQGKKKKGRFFNPTKPSMQHQGIASRHHAFARVSLPTQIAPRAPSDFFLPSQPTLLRERAVVGGCACANSRELPGRCFSNVPGHQPLQCPSQRWSSSRLNVGLNLGRPVGPGPLAFLDRGAMPPGICGRRRRAVGGPTTWPTHQARIWPVSEIQSRARLAWASNLALTSLWGGGGTGPCPFFGAWPP